METYYIKSVSDCLKCFLQQKEEEEKKWNYLSGRTIFRGLSNSNWNVVSSAARRLSLDKRPHCQRDFIRYHVNLIKHARRFGYGHYQLGYQLSDLEILAVIQHLGGATCLTDFSTNFLIALWFATKPTKNGNTDKECDGKIVWLDLSNPDNYDQIMYYTEDGEEKPKTIQQVLTSYEFIKHTKKQNKALPSFWVWEPKKLNIRIDMQESFFLFGLRKFPQQMEKEDSLKYREIIIPAASKELIRSELENYLGICAETVYHDLQGYALNTNGCSIPIGHSVLSQTNCLEIAKDCIKHGEYSLAISYLDQMIECNQTRKRNNTKECIKKIFNNSGKDINNNCNINMGEVFFWRGRAVENRVEMATEEAILNYHEAIDYFLERGDLLNVLLYDAYQNIIYLYYDIHDYNSALDEAKKLWNIYVDNKNVDNDADRDGHDAILTIMELSIMLNQKDTFIYYLNDAIRTNIVDRFKYTNGAIMWILFRYLGKMIWDLDNLVKSNEDSTSSYDETKVKKWMDVIENRISNTLSPDNPNIPKDYVKFVGYYYWDFNDILDEIKISQHLDARVIRDAVLLIEKADEAQGRLINHLLLINDAFD